VTRIDATTGQSYDYNGVPPMGASELNLEESRVAKKVDWYYVRKG